MQRVQMSDPTRETQHHQRSRETRGVILRAAVTCLDQFGYAETTFAKVQAQAGLSRGAMTHHFPTKQALVAETALLLLDNAMRPFRRWEGSDDQSPEPVYDLVINAWQRMVNSPEGRAFVEILVACRTDSLLKDTLSEGLIAFDQSGAESIRRFYVGRGGDAEDATLLWAIFRSFIRGLVIHQQFVSDPDYIHRMLTRFAQMMERELTLRAE